ncbi:hypothetical protein K474DRAFT_1520157 [Panus rudis PR-1116 ss-1]|nr:hypothetical protein K474DRAFT_1520157 [Panus rudis PR-1116 ss-1]
MTSNIGSSGRVIPTGKGETFTQLVTRKCKENPFVPIGTAATVFALVMAFTHTRTGNQRSFNNWLRARVVAQGFTVAALVGGSYMIKTQSDANHNDEVAAKARAAREEADAAKEKREFEERLKAAEEAWKAEVGQAESSAAQGVHSQATSSSKSWWSWGSGSSQK